MSSLANKEFTRTIQTLDSGQSVDTTVKVDKHGNHLYAFPKFPPTVNLSSVDSKLPIKMINQLKSTPQLDLNLIQEEIDYDSNAPSKKFADMIEDYNRIPFELFSGKSHLKWFLKSEVIKINSFIDNYTFNELKTMLRNPITSQVYTKLFWLTHYVKFQSNNVPVLKNLRNQLTKCYSQLMPVLRKSRQSEHLITLVHFVLAYIIHAFHFRIFTQQPETSDTRFILDCYHIVLYELNGLLISDFFINKKIELIFENRFFFYRQESIRELVKIDPNKGSNFIFKLARNKENLDSKIDDMVMSQAMADLKKYKQTGGKNIASKLKNRLVTDTNIDELKYMPEMSIEEENMQKYEAELSKIKKMGNLGKLDGLNMFERGDKSRSGYASTPKQSKRKKKILKRSNTESKFSLGIKSARFGKSLNRKKIKKKAEFPRYTARDQKKTYDLFSKLNKKFSHIETYQTTKTGLTSNRMNTLLKKGLEEIVQDPDCNAKMQMRVLKFGEHKGRVNKKERIITDAELEKKEFQRKTSNYIDSRLPKLKKRVIFNCSSVSPAVNKLLGNSKLPVKKKQITLSSYQDPEFEAKQMGQLYNMANGMNSAPKLKNERLRLFRGVGKSVGALMSLNHKVANVSTLLKYNDNARTLSEYKGLDGKLKRKFMHFFQVQDVSP